MNRDTVERHQVWAYLAAIAVGLALGNVAPATASLLERLLWPALAWLMYTTFTQIPLAQLPAAFKDARFVWAALVGNFVVLPVVVWGVLAWVPAHGPLRLGLVLVLLVPCTDWFIAFAHQGGGDARRATTLTPVLLIAQMVLLPIYLWLFMGPAYVNIVPVQSMANIFGIMIIVPLGLAFLTQRWCGKREARAGVMHRLGGCPIPTLAFVLMLIAASQVGAVIDSVHLMTGVLLACVVFLVVAVMCSMALAKALRLPVEQARTLLFSMGTRNSFVVLPFALALPAHEQLAAIVIVLQSLVELLGMLILLWLVPRTLLPRR